MMTEPAQKDLRYTSAPERRERMLELVEEQGFCAMSELSSALSVSEMTIRRDAQRLATEQRLRIVYGGVSVLPQSALLGTGDFRERATRMSDAKRSIACSAASLISSGDTIALDAGTTSLEVARVLPLGLQTTVITHSAPVVAALLDRPDIQMICLGGTLHHETQSFAGLNTTEPLTELRIGRLFLSASSIGSGGVYCGNDFDAVTKRALIAVSDEIVLVSDSSKFRSSASVRVCRLEGLDKAITDGELRESDERMLLEHNIGLIRATKLRSGKENK